MPVRPWLELTVGHPFFAAGVLSAARLEPDAATAARLRGLRLTAKARPGGLVIFGDIDSGGRPLVPVLPGVRLRFLLGALSPDAVGVTDLGGLERERGWVFTDEGASGGALRLVQRETRARETLAAPRAGRSTLVLSGRPRAGTDAAAVRLEGARAGVSIAGYDAAGRRVTLDGAQEGERVQVSYPVDPPRAPGVLAPIEIGLPSEVVAEAAAGRPRRWTAPLQPRAARWCYHVQTDLADPLNTWRIVQAAGGNGRTVAFADAGRSEVADTASDDETGAALKRRDPALRVIRFVSDAAVPCSEAPVRGLELHAGASRVFSALPNPSPDAMARVGGQIVFREVVRTVA